MSEELYYPPESVSSKAHIGSMEEYRELYERSIKFPKNFGQNKPNIFVGLENGIK
tara:strand:+ start:740 stop:904 length:165 start_codon:yes stop_codon:yes gene_type:complete